jgi:hypothetical protein
MVPVQGEWPSGATGSSGRVVIEWRGIPLANPFQFDTVGPNQVVPIVKRWREGPLVCLKLVHPTKGTTVDYVVRCLFNPRLAGTPTQQVFAFLEFFPGCPGVDESVPVWTAVERLSSTAIRTLGPEEVHAQQAMIDTIVNEQLGVPLEVLEQAFGPLESWQNPDWGEPGNIHRVCTQCLKPLADAVVSCPDCAPPRPAEPPRRSRWQFWR